MTERGTLKRVAWVFVALALFTLNLLVYFAGTTSSFRNGYIIWIGPTTAPEGFQAKRSAGLDFRQLGGIYDVHHRGLHHPVSPRTAEIEHFQASGPPSLSSNTYWIVFLWNACRGTFTLNDRLLGLTNSTDFEFNIEYCSTPTISTDQNIGKSIGDTIGDAISELSGKVRLVEDYSLQLLLFWSSTLAIILSSLTLLLVVIAAWADKIGKFRPFIAFAAFLTFCGLALSASAITGTTIKIIQTINKEKRSTGVEARFGKIWMIMAWVAAFLGGCFVSLCWFAMNRNKEESGPPSDEPGSGGLLKTLASKMGMAQEGPPGGPSGPPPPPPGEPPGPPPA